MKTFEFTSPEGKTYEIDAPDDATQEQAFGVLQGHLSAKSAQQQTPPQEQHPDDSLLGRMKQSVNQADLEATQAMNSSRGVMDRTLDTAAAGGRLVGKLGGNILESIIPQSAMEKASGVASKIAQNPLIQGYQQNVVEPVGKYLGENYPNAVRRASDVYDIAQAAPIAGAVKIGAGTAKSATNALGSKLIKSGDEAILKNVVQAVQPEYRMTSQMKNLMEEGRKFEEKGLFNSKALVPNEQELKSAQLAKEAKGFSPSNTFQKNLNAVNNEIGKKAEYLKDALQKENINLAVVDPYTNQVQHAFTPVLQKIVDEIPKNVGLTANAQQKAAQMAEAMKGFINNNPPTAAGLLEARKQFDNWIENTTQTGKFPDPEIVNAKSYVTSKIRQAANDFVAERSSNVDVKKSLSEQSALFRAQENMIPKAAHEGRNSAERLGDRLEKVMPFHSGLSKGVAMTTGLGVGGAALYNDDVRNGILSTALPLAGLYGAYKGITSPSLRIGLGKMLGGSLPKKADEAFINASKNAGKGLSQENIAGLLAQSKGDGVPTDYSPKRLALPDLRTENRRSRLAEAMRKYENPEPAQGGMVIHMGQEKQLALPSPEMAGNPPEWKPYAQRDFEEKRADIQATQELNARNEARFEQPRYQEKRIAANRLLNTVGNIGTNRRRELLNDSLLLSEGDISQNEFVAMAMQKYGLNTQKARELSRQVKMMDRDSLNQKIKKPFGFGGEK